MRMQSTVFSLALVFGLAIPVFGQTSPNAAITERTPPAPEVPAEIQRWPESALMAGWLLRRSPDPVSSARWLEETYRSLQAETGEMFIWDPLKQVKFDEDLSFAINQHILAEAKLTEIERHFLFHGRNPDKIAGFFAEIQRCFRENDRGGLAHLVNYPIIVAWSGRDHLIETEAAFVRACDHFLTPALAKTVADQKFEELTGNSDGTDIGRGDIWFEAFGSYEKLGSYIYKIFRINDTTHTNVP